jgi:hypothetical protein
MSDTPIEATLGAHTFRVQDDHCLVYSPFGNLDFLAVTSLRPNDVIVGLTPNGDDLLIHTRYAVWRLEHAASDDTAWTLYLEEFHPQEFHPQTYRRLIEALLERTLIERATRQQADTASRRPHGGSAMRIHQPTEAP